jgi:hypothetical protein
MLIDAVMSNIVCVAARICGCGPRFSERPRTGGPLGAEKSVRQHFHNRDDCRENADTTAQCGCALHEMRHT